MITIRFHVSNVASELLILKIYYGRDREFRAKMINNRWSLFQIERCISKRMQILPDECFGRLNNRYNDALLETT